MRSIRSFVAPLTAAVLFAAAASPALAQQAVASTPTLVVTTSTGAVVEPPRKVADLRFVVASRALSRSGEDILARVTVTDSSGTILANLHVPGERAARRMLVTVVETDLVLQGETPAGVLTIQLDQDREHMVGTVAGRWRLGRQQGELRWRGSNQ